MKALICGVSGQDGAYLADLLIKKGYNISPKIVTYETSFNS